MKKNHVSLMIVSVILMDILSGMEFDLFVPSFAQIQSYFQITTFWTESLLSINFIGYFIGLFVVGSLADRLGRKKVILTGLIIFILGSLCCVFAHDYILLLVGRFFQGIGIAAPAILSFLIIADRFPIQEQQKWMAMLNGSLNFAAAGAPVIGSYIALYYQWRGNFTALLLLGLFTFIVSVFFVPYDSPLGKIEKLSLKAYVAILKNKSLMLFIVNIILMTTPYWIFVGISPLLYVKSLHVSLHVFGFYQGILACAVAIGSIGLGFIVKKYSQKTWLVLGLFLYGVSLIVMLGVTVFYKNNPWLITAAMLVFVITQLIPSTIIYPICLNLLPEAKGKVAAIEQGGGFIFVSLILQITGYFYGGSFEFTGFIIALLLVGMIITQMMIMNRGLVYH
jgi:DHA1 family bicyclomycin/chloramphenicol resistance-like MFS transporter